MKLKRESLIDKYSDLVNGLSEIAKKNRIILEDTDLLRSILFSYEKKQQNIDAVLSIIKNSTIKRFLNMDSITKVEFNMIVDAVEENCFFSRMMAVEFVTVILYSFGFGLFYDSECCNIIKKKSILSDADYVPINSSYYKELESIKEYIENSNDSALKEERTAIAFEQLYKSGNPVAIYLKGRCYEKGLGTAVEDADEAKECFKKAAEMGVPDAAGYLGDKYYDEGSYTEAYKAYTQIGAISLNEDRKEKLKKILHAANFSKKMFYGSLAVFVASIIYCVLLLKGQFCSDGCSHIICGIVGIIINILSSFLSVINFKFYPYDNDSPFFISINAISIVLLTFFSLVL